MARTLEGFGGFVLRDPTNDEAYAIRPNAFTITQEITSENILAYPTAGVNTLQTLTTVTTETTYTLSIDSGWLAEESLPFLFNQRPSTGDITVLRQEVVTVPAAGATQEVTVTGLTADQDIQATIISNSDGDTYMTQVDTATGAAATGEFDVSADTISFASVESDAGKSVLITYTAAETGLTYIGGPATIATQGTIEFFGKVAFSDAPSDIWSLWCKEVVKNDGFEFGSDTDNSTFAYSLNTPADWNLPFLLYKN